MPEVQMKDWTMRYKDRSMVKEGTIRARDLVTAQNVAQAFCNKEATLKLLEVVDPILADESILDRTPENLSEFDALSQVERLAKMWNKTPDEVLDELKRRRKVQLSGEAIPRRAEDVLATRV